LILEYLVIFSIISDIMAVGLKEAISLIESFPTSGFMSEV
jgi:hypothetical protein